MEHCPGKRNVVADQLSRPELADKNAKENELIIAALVREMTPEVEETFRRLAYAQDATPEIYELKQAIHLNQGPTDHAITDDVLYRTSNIGTRAVLPTTTAKEIAQECHEIYGHAGARKCYLSLREDFYCPHLYRIIRKRIAQCVSCQKNKTYTQGVFATMKNILSNGPNELVSLDFYRPLPNGRYGMKFILAIIDTFSKLVKLYALKKATADATIRCLINDYIPKYGKPTSVLSDQGTQFTSGKWARALKGNGIKKIITAIRHPQANPIERTNRELSRFFRSLLQDQHHKWVDYLEVIETCINHTHHETTGCIPQQLHTGEAPMKPWENLIYIPKVATPEHEKLITFARENMRRKREKIAAAFNKAHRLTEFQEGDLVPARTGTGAQCL